MAAINIGPIHKKDIMKCGIMNEKGCPEFATVLAFDVRLDAEAALLAEELHVRVMSADIIYHLFDQWTRFMEEIIRRRKEEAMAIAVYPCLVHILPKHVYNKKNPMLFGVEVLGGVVKLGTMLCIPKLGLDVGVVTGIQLNGKEVDKAKKGLSVSLRVENEGNPTITYGRQFDDKSGNLYSKISRLSINALKDFFLDEVPKEDWDLIKEMKTALSIP